MLSIHRIGVLVALASVASGGACGQGAREPQVTEGLRLPQAEFVLVEDAGHFPFIEQPEAFLDSVRAFLRGVR